MCQWMDRLSQTTTATKTSCPTAINLRTRAAEFEKNRSGVTNTSLRFFSYPRVLHQFFEKRASPL